MTRFNVIRVNVIGEREGRNESVFALGSLSRFSRGCINFTMAFYSFLSFPSFSLSIPLPFSATPSSLSSFVLPGARCSFNFALD